MDPDEYRAQSIERWDSVARGWGAQRERMSAASAPVNRWLIDALGLRSGGALLELACGPGETGLLALERLQPGGKLISTDASEEMIALVEQRAAELGVSDAVEARVMQAEWIDLPVASVDAVVCRWGYMLLADPGASLRETRRVLKPGGRVSLAAWDGAPRNPWASAIGMELVGRGLMERPQPGEPGQFAWSDKSVIADALEDAGFTGIEVETIEFSFQHPDLDAWWDVTLDQGPALGPTVSGMTPAERDELRDALDERLAAYVKPDGSVEIPAATHVAAADA
jgi:SAM-dependent methyltransferase